MHVLNMKVDPWRDLARLQNEVNRLFAGARPDSAVSREYPPVSLYAGEDTLVLTSELPGVEPENLDITVTGDTITLRGTRPAEALSEGASFHRQERTSGQFTRTLQLPFEVDPEKTEAKYEKGVLQVRLTRPEKMKLKKVTVKAL